MKCAYGNLARRNGKSWKFRSSFSCQKSSTKSRQPYEVPFNTEALRHLPQSTRVINQLTLWRCSKTTRKHRTQAHGYSVFQCHFRNTIADLQSTTPHLQSVLTPFSDHLHSILRPSSLHSQTIFTPFSDHLHSILRPSSLHPQTISHISSHQSHFNITARISISSLHTCALGTQSLAVSHLSFKVDDLRWEGMRTRTRCALILGNDSTSFEVRPPFHNQSMTMAVDPLSR
jgi:hypothetical protein